MPEPTLTDAELQALQRLDTPTVCNALEVLEPRRRGFGFTTRPFVCPQPELSPMVGYARTATIRASQPSGRDGAALKAQRLRYYAHVERGPRPSLVVIQDIDDHVGFGAFWGEVQTHVHRGLGAVGAVTNGCIRDLDAVAGGFRMLAGSVAPSHGWVHLEDFGRPVNVHGMVVHDGDLVHADRHGAVVIPHAFAREVPQTADLLARREAVVLEAAGQPGFTTEALERAMGAAEDIH